MRGLYTGKREPRGEAELGDLVDENAVLGQFGADRVEESRSAERWSWPCRWRICGVPLLHLRLAGRALGVVRRQRVDQAAQDRAGVADQRDRRAAANRSGFLGIGVDADDGEVRVGAPLRERVEQAGADGEHHIGLAPQFAAERQRAR